MTDVPSTPSFGVRDLLRIPDFRRLYLAQAISDLGDGMTYLALFLLVLDLTGSTAAIALMSILVALPPVTIGLFAGAYADRHDRRRIMLVSDTIRAVVVVAMVLFARADALPVLFALACLQAVIGTFFTPARVAMVPRVVPEHGLLAANSLSQATRMVAGVLGAGITGLIAAAAGQVWPVFLVDGATFLASVILVLGVSRSAGLPSAAAAASAKATGIGSAVVDGLRVIARSRPLIAALAGISVTMLGMGAINVLFIPFLVDELGASPAWAGPLEAAQTISMIIAGGLVASLATRMSVPRLFVGGIVGLSACVGLLSVAPGPWALLLIMFAVGLFVMPVQATTMTLVQRSTGDATRGRVAGALNAVIQTASIGSMAAAGILADVVGMRTVFALGALVTLLAAVVAAALFRGSAVGSPADPARAETPAAAASSGVAGTA
ncbi:MAG TPA: MFS transporter [Candidatus Limnocylindrales bacterium]|nr:MFS transporter [Candidatus Limnocylindrales bacterium]